MWPIALFYKELRQLQGILLLGLLAVILTLLDVSRDQTAWGTHRLIPLYNATVDLQIPLIAGGLMVVVGFWQTLSETYRSTWLFLLHRPVSRSSITLVKLGSGLVLISLVLSVPVLIYGLYVSQPGVIPAPFRWDMTSQLWKKLLSLSPLYLLAYLSGLRKARWHFSRLFPVAVGFILYEFFKAFFLLSVPFTLLSLLFLNGILIVAILQQQDLEDYS